MRDWAGVRALPDLHRLRSPLSRSVLLLLMVVMDLLVQQVLGTTTSSSTLQVGLLSEVQVRHHGLQPLPLLAQLQLQLRNDLHLHPRLRSALVIQRVLSGDVLQEGGQVGAVGLAAGPLAGSVAEERVLLLVAPGEVVLVILGFGRSCVNENRLCSKICNKTS